jgi:hypothetical protein
MALGFWDFTAPTAVLKNDESETIDKEAVVS